MSARIVNRCNWPLAYMNIGRAAGQASACNRTSQQAFFVTSALLFAASAALTTVWCRSMSAMGEMPMPGGWTMSMAWVPMPGQTWLGVAASFVGMWTVMMVSMMLPSFAPTLLRYRQTMGSIGEMRLSWLTALVAIGYFFVWTMCGVAVFLLGAALAKIEVQQPALARVAPIAVGVIVVISGMLQFSAWKAHHLACYRDPSGSRYSLPADAARAWQEGLGLGLHCTCGCAGFTAILLSIGVMDLRVMGLLTAAITAERLAPNRERVARVIGIVVVAVGLLLITRAAAGAG